jgi:hypothetical protein
MGWELNGLAERLVTETREAIFALSADAEILAWSAAPRRWSATTPRSASAARSSS